MIETVECFFARGCGRCSRFGTPECSVRRWESGLRALQSLCLSAGLVETVRWGQPCYRFADRNIALISALREDFRMSVFHAQLLDDDSGLLEKAGPNTQHANMIRFTHEAQVKERERDIRRLLEQAKQHAQSGVRPPASTPIIELPVELVQALEADEQLQDAFDALTPGRQRSYVIHIGGAKQAATRNKRAERVRDKILAGKGFNER